MKIYLCEDSLEGVFTAIYNIYEDHCSIEDTMVSLTEEPCLFAEYVPVQPDCEKTLNVIRTLKRRFGEEDYQWLCMALASPDISKAQAVYRTVALGLQDRNCRPGHLLDRLAENEVHRVFTLARGANNEFLHLRGFVRFQELEKGVLLSRIAPKNNVLTFLMPHFADRLPMENFLLYDEGRRLFGIHPAGREWYLAQGENVEEQIAQAAGHLSEGELRYQELFRYFCHRIAIEERKNLELQRNMLPLRFQEYMVEFR